MDEKRMNVQQVMAETRKQFCILGNMEVDISDDELKDCESQFSKEYEIDEKQLKFIDYYKSGKKEPYSEASLKFINRLIVIEKR